MPSEQRTNGDGADGWADLGRWWDVRCMEGTLKRGRSTVEVCLFDAFRIFSGCSGMSFLGLWLLPMGLVIVVLQCWSAAPENRDDSVRRRLKLQI